MKANTAQKTRRLLAFAAISGAMIANASALTTDALETAIESSITTAEGLIVAGFAVTALFILVKIIKKGAAKVG